MPEEKIFKIKCPGCDEEFGISLNIFDEADKVRLTCYEGHTISVSWNKEKKIIEIKRE